MILAIDPGSQKSGIAYINPENYRPRLAEKIANTEVLEFIPEGDWTVVIEMVAHYGTGMPAGKTVFDTCVWIGRFYQHFHALGFDVHLIFRSEVKMNICGTMRAKDSNIRQALVDRFAAGASNYGKGTKANKGWFYGFAADMWQAYALGVTYLDSQKAPF